MPLAISAFLLLDAAPYEHSGDTRIPHRIIYRLSRLQQSCKMAGVECCAFIIWNCPEKHMTYNV